MQVSIILVSYNTAELTRNCLNSVYEKTKDVDFEIYVVDNNSTDGSAEMLESEFPQVKLIKNTENKGFGAANNIAIKECKGKYVFLLNTDTLLINNAIKILYDFMEKRENSDVGCCSGNLYYEDMSYQHSYNVAPNLTYYLLIVLFLRKIFSKLFKNYYVEHIHDEELVPLSEPKSVGFVTGADMFLRKSVLDKAGSFDEDFFMYYEDTELCHRIKNNGFGIYMVPEAKIIHIRGKSSGNNLKRMQLLKAGEYLYYRKCKGIISAHAAKLLYYFVYLRYFLQSKEKKYLDMLRVNYKTKI